jgi:hypothetical protein
MVVPGLMRLKLPALNCLLERRIASAVAAGSDSKGLQEIVRCVDSAIAIGSPLVRGGCLTRNLTLYYFLRRTGLPVMLCFGARSRDGQLVEEAGHCWLEKDGQPFLERGDPYEYSVPIMILPFQFTEPAKMN